MWLAHIDLQPKLTTKTVAVPHLQLPSILELVIMVTHTSARSRKIKKEEEQPYMSPLSCKHFHISHILVTNGDSPTSHELPMR